MLDDPYGIERGLGALRSLSRKPMKGHIWKRISLRIKPGGKSLYIIVCFPLEHHGWSSASCGQFGRCPYPKGLHNKEAFLANDDLCFSGHQLLWPLRDAFGRQETRQDMVTAPFKRAGKCAPPLGTERHAL